MKTHCKFYVVLQFTSQLHHLGKSQYTTAITRVWAESAVSLPESSAADDSRSKYLSNGSLAP